MSQRGFKQTVRRFLVVAVLLWGFPTFGGEILKEVPRKINLTARYLFYLHGKIIEDQGTSRPRSEQFGFYEYDKIVETLQDKGIVVISEARLKPVGISDYAQKVANQVRVMIKAGARPQQITIVGASKGGLIAMYASALLQDRNINYAFLASCSDGAFRMFQKGGLKLSGNVLSIRDLSDAISGSCRPFFEAAGPALRQHREIELKLGLGHGIVYRPLAEWVEPVIAWTGAGKTTGD
jgi:hypothetical protein